MWHAGRKLVLSRSSDLLNDAGEARHADLGTPMGNWYGGRSLDLLGDARHAMLVRHAEKQLVSKIRDKKKGGDRVVTALNVTS